MTAFFRAHTTALLLLGCAFFAGSVGLLYAHALKIRAMRDVGFAITADVQPLTQRKAMLSEQAEIARLQALTKGSLYREAYDLYVLPEKADSARTVAVLETLLTYLREQGIVRSIEAVEAWKKDSASVDVSLTVITAPGGAVALLDLMDVSGVLTVNDAFTEAERTQLLTLTERENPTTIAAVEQFLGSDLLQYAKVPQLAESRLFASVGTEAFERDFSALADASRMRAFAQTALMLDGAPESLWPLPLFTIETQHMEVSDDGDVLTLTLRARGKGDARDL